MPAPDAISPWHQLILKQFSSRNYYSFLEYLKALTKTPWSMGVQQSQNPAQVLLIFKDRKGTLEDLFLKITPQGPRSVKVESGEMSWSAGPQKIIQYKSYVPQDKVGIHPSFDWIELEGLLHSKQVRMAKKTHDARLLENLIKRASRRTPPVNISSGQTRITIGPSTGDADIIRQIFHGIMKNHEVILSPKFQIVPVDMGDRAGWLEFRSGRPGEFYWTRKQGIAPDDPPRVEADLIAPLAYKNWIEMD